MSYVQVELPSFSSHKICGSPQETTGSGTAFTLEVSELTRLSDGAGLRGFTSFCHAQAIGTD